MRSRANASVSRATPSRTQGDDLDGAGLVRRVDASAPIEDARAAMATELGALMGETGDAHGEVLLVYRTEPDGPCKADLFDRVGIAVESTL